MLLFLLIVILDTDGCMPLYGMKVKSDIIKFVKKCYSDITDPRQKHIFVLVMRDNAGENKPHELNELFEGQELLQHFNGAMAEWTGRGSNKLNHDVIESNHG